MPKQKPSQEKTKPAEENGAAFAKLIRDSIEETRKLGLVRELERLETIASVTELVDTILLKAVESSASDIHIDPEPATVLVRYRIDGILHDILSLKKELHPLIITRIKVLAGLRTDEHLMAQDGRFRTNENEIDIRVSIVPTFYGENIVMRLLMGEAKALPLDQLGFGKRDLTILQRYVRKPYGMILATGPTGSGKTSTLYAVLRVLNSRSISIVTIEDPIEYSMAGVTQIQVNAQTSLTFANGLRSIVRQDPNVIMVGEIRDQETAGIAVNAAMTGHLLLSTLHTNDAPTTLPRLFDMHIEPFLIASTVNIAIGQRLVRKLCPDCRQEYILGKDEQESLKNIVSAELLNRQTKLWRAAGCDTCNDIGYQGRIGIFEVLEMTDRIRGLVMRRANADEIRAAAREGGMTTMLEDGFAKATQGITSIDEILRVAHD